MQVKVWDKSLSRINPQAPRTSTIPTTKTTEFKKTHSIRLPNNSLHITHRSKSRRMWLREHYSRCRRRKSTISSISCLRNIRFLKRLILCKIVQSLFNTSRNSSKTGTSKSAYPKNRWKNQCSRAKRPKSLFLDRIGLVYTLQEPISTLSAYSLTSFRKTNS